MDPNADKQAISDPNYISRSQQEGLGDGVFKNNMYLESRFP